MNKRIYKQSLLVILITLYFIVFFCYLYIRNTIRYNDVIVNTETYENIKSNRNEYDSDILDSIIFNKSVLFKTSNTNEFFYSMIVKDNNKYNPFIKYEANLDNTEIVLLNNQITDELITNNDHIKLLIFNDEYYKEYEIVVTTLPIMNISFEDNDENEKRLNYNTTEDFEDYFDNSINGKLNLFDNTTGKVEESNLLFHVRGASSTFYPKKGFKLSLKDDNGNSINKELLNMRKDDDWILYSGYNDQERIRNVYASRLWYDSCASDNQFNVNAGMYYKYIELFINGDYHGLYALGFPVDEKQLNIDQDEYLFKKSIWYDETIENVMLDKGMYGYVLKSDSKYSDKANKRINTYFKELLASDDDSHLLNTVDINNNIDFLLFNFLIENIDCTQSNNSKNLYIVFKNDEYDKKALYIPWDMDLSFGNTYLPGVKLETQEYGLSENYVFTMYYNNPVGKLISDGDKEVLDLYKNKYSELRNSKWSDEHLINLLDEYDVIHTSGSYNRDINRWPKSLYSKDNDFTRLKEYILNRVHFMDEYINNL